MGRRETFFPFYFYNKLALHSRQPLDSIQLTNWILWNGKFYYRDVIKMTITRAKGEGNGHFYHIEVIDLPFHTIYEMVNSITEMW